MPSSNIEQPSAEELARIRERSRMFAERDERISRLIVRRLEERKREHRTVD